MSKDQKSDETILEEAQRTVVERGKSYDHPLTNHARIARFWNAWIKGKYGAEFELDPEDITWMMIFVKASRDMHVPKRDNLVDVAGYAHCTQECREPTGLVDPKPLRQ